MYNVKLCPDLGVDVGHVGPLDRFIPVDHVKGVTVRRAAGRDSMLLIFSVASHMVYMVCVTCTRGWNEREKEKEQKWENALPSMLPLFHHCSASSSAHPSASFPSRSTCLLICLSAEPPVGLHVAGFWRCFTYGVSGVCNMWKGVSFFCVGHPT